MAVNTRRTRAAHLVYPVGEDVHSPDHGVRHDARPAPRACLNTLSSMIHAPQRGQSMVEFALVLPLLCLMLLAVADFARVLRYKQVLEQAAHRASLTLLTNPSLLFPSSTSTLTSTIQAQTGLSNISVTPTYSVDSNGDDRAVVTVTYNYPLLTPGLRNLAYGPISNNTFAISVNAASVAATTAPTVTLNGTGTVVTVYPPADITVPTPVPSATPLILSCVLSDNGVIVPTPKPCTGSPATWSVTPQAGGDSFTAQTMQSNAVMSPASSPVASTPTP